MVSICLNALIESENILDLIKSCYHLIDNYCLCNVSHQEEMKIKEFFDEKGIPGIIFNEPFQNYGFNRQIAFQKAKNLADYLLLLDNDMILIDQGFNKEELTQDVYLINGNIRLIKTSCQVQINEPVYEYYDIKKPYSQETLTNLLIEDNTKPNYERNIILLNQALKRNPNNPRNIFYLAYCYQKIGDIENAKKWYQRKLEEKGWEQEVYMTYYFLCQIFKNNLPLLKKYALEGHQMGIGRIETLYLYLNVLLIHQKYEEAYQLAKHVKIQNTDGLFIQQDIYDWKFNYLMTMLYFYVEEYQKGFDLSIDLLKENILPEEEFNTVLENIGFYLDKDDFTTDISFLLKHQILSKVAFKQIDRLIMNFKEFDDFRHIPLNLSNNNEIYFFITTNNYKSLKKTMNSFLNHCEDVNLISKMICLDNSSYEDRLKINKKFPFFDFIYLENDEIECLNLIRNIVRKEKPQYVLYLQDNWLFFKKDKYLSKMKNILDKKEIQQVLFNQCYGKYYQDIDLKDFIDKDFYYEHLYQEDSWPYFSLYPSLFLGKIFDKLGEFQNLPQFEKEFALRFTDEGFKTGFLKGIHCRQLEKID